MCRRQTIGYEFTYQQTTAPRIPYHDGDQFDEQMSMYKTRIEALLPHGLTETGGCYNCDAVKFASERIQALISDENGLRHNRITWFANIEGFLWLSFAAVIGEPVGWTNGFWLLIIIPVIGVLICLSAISAIWDADYACKILLKKWRVIQNHELCSIYTEIPVVGLTCEELKPERTTSISRWYFAFFVLLGWVVGFVGVVVTKIGLCLGLPWWYYVVFMLAGWVASLGLVVHYFPKAEVAWGPPK